MKENVRGKILAILIATIMMTSMLVTFNMTTNVSATYSSGVIPGVDIWEDGNSTVGDDVINTSTKTLVYDEDTAVVIEINNSASVHWAADTTYYLYYPVYSGIKGGTYNLTWRKYVGSGVFTPEILPRPSSGTADYYFGEGDENDLYLNRSGLWLIDNDDIHDASNLSQMDATIPAWFWVNTSTDYVITLSEDEFYYDDEGEVTVTVLQDSSAPDALVAIYSEYNNQLVGTWTRNKLTDTNGNLKVPKNSTYFTWAGNWTVAAYYDMDEDTDGYFHTYREGTSGWQYYNESYGNSSYTPLINADYYNYTLCGPWDPPEYNATFKTIRVKPGIPTITLTNTTQYRTFTGRIDINVTDSDGMGITGLNVTILNETGDYPGVYFGTEIGNGNYSVIANWSLGSTGTWTVVVRNSTAGDGAVGNNWLEEWNGTAEFTVSSAPGLQIKIIDDGDGNNDLEIPAGPAGLGAQGVRQIKFQVINESHKYYGKHNTGGEAAARKNITISGDACLLDGGKTLQELYEIGKGIVSFDGDRNWTVNLIPIMDTAANGGGEITISAKWEDHGGVADPVTIYVGGSQYNGSLVSIIPSEITIDSNITLDITVTDPNYPTYGYMNADVQLYYINDSGYVATEHLINWSTSTSDTGGVYTFHFNATQQTTNQTYVNDWSTYKANRYIVAYADIGNGEYGYAYAKLVPKHDLKVTVEAASSASTTTLMAGQDYDKMWFNVSIVDSNGNVSGYPTIGSGQNVLQFEIYNETGHNVTDLIGASFDWDDLTLSTGDDANHSLTGSNHYIVKPGTYTVYAYNATHDSTGNNATLIVEPVNVTCSIKEFIWNYDDNISATFYVKYNGEPVNGTLRIDNMSAVGGYNKTWANTSFDGSTDQGGNTSKHVIVTNGVVTIHNITANYLKDGLARQNITFWFKPKKSGSQYARATGVIPVKVADVKPTPNMVALNEPATVNILVSGRGEPLPGVFVSIEGPGNIALNGTTGSNGIATFSFVPTVTGDIDILVENRTTGTKIAITAHTLNIDAPAQVEEDEEFTVTVKDENDNPVEGAQVKFTGTGETKTTDANGQVTFTATVTGTLPYATYKLTATKAGYRGDEETIMVANTFQLYIDAPDEVDAGSTFTVKVTSDAGVVYGVDVTFNGKTKTITGPDGVTFTAPSKVDKATPYDITASKEGYKTATDTVTVKPAGIPGFELVTLIAAIGVAFILLRRRH